MKRDPARMADREYDLVVIGGGISGACVAWDATLRGLAVALVEKGDFGAATSAASSKLIHSGVRYLQQGLVHKVRESIRERRNFLRIAPHLIHPVPFLIPTYGHLFRGVALVAAGMTIYELLRRDRSDPGEPWERLPRFRVLGRDEVLRREPTTPQEGLTGGILYPECQMYSSERTTLAFLAGAAARGADVANYVEVEEFLRSGERVGGVRARDLTSGEEFEIRARLVANVSGPWALRVIDSLKGSGAQPEMRHSKGCHLVTHALTNGHALALATSLKQESVISRGGRHIFLIPWRHRTLIGTTDVPFHGDPDNVRATDRDIDDFLKEINASLPAAGLTRDRVLYSFGGLYPLVNKKMKEKVYQGGGKYLIYDHRRTDGVEGVITAIGAKYTTARRLAEKCVDLAFRKLGKEPPPCTTATTCLDGGDISDLGEYLEGEIRRQPAGLGEEMIRELVYSHGTRYGDVLAPIQREPWLAERVSRSRPTAQAEVRHAAREEMAVKLTDVVFRRTGLGTIGHPGRECLETCASILAEEHGWRAERVRDETDEVEAALRRAT